MYAVVITKVTDFEIRKMQTQNQSLSNINI